MAKEPKRIGYELLTDELKALIGGETGTGDAVYWTTILEKPTSFPPSNHTHSEFHSHTNKALIDSITQDKINQWDKITTHNHDEQYYTESEVNILLDGKSNTDHTHSGLTPAEHTHDDLAPLIHTHQEGDIVGLDKYTKDEVNTLLINKSNTTHNHDGSYYKKSEVDSKISNKSDKTHTHTKSNISDFSHTHLSNEITNLNIPTDTKQLIKSDIYTKSEIDNMMVESSLGDMTKAIYDTDNDGVINHAEVADVVDWDGIQNKPTHFLPDEHTHSELHTHSNKSILDSTQESFTTDMKNKLASLQNYIHPVGDGNLHVPANGTTNSGKILKSTNVAGGIGWGTLTPSEIGASPSSHMHTVSQITNFPSFSRITLSTTQPTDGYWLKEV